MPTSKVVDEIIPDVCFNLSHRKFNGPTDKQANGFDPKRDYGVVLQGLSPDIGSIIDNGVIPAGSTIETFSNQLDSVEKIGCRVNDKFDMLRIQQSINFDSVQPLQPNGGTGSSSGA